MVSIQSAEFFPPIVLRTLYPDHGGEDMNTWRDKYNTGFKWTFTVEQDFVDAVFMQMVMYNYGIFIDPATLRVDGPEGTGYQQSNESRA